MPLLAAATNQQFRAASIGFHRRERRAGIGTATPRLRLAANGFGVPAF